ncbi:cupin domain-containing protein [Rugosimonospora acidiphila]|uniref:Cupin domain-containing protein n=1 Tax=Rugosimonospora acidiphila TaxID=556531 RepID=A0ABP9RK03_9ACTN
MSAIVDDQYRPVLVRAGEAEHLESIGHTLLADSSATRGALSSHRITLGRGADGAVPHRHNASWELFFILDGRLDVLLGDEVVTANEGDLLVAPPGMTHAFGAHRDSAADALIVLTPGVERFDYFRHVVRLRAGTEPAQTLLGLQDRFDTHFTGGSVPSSSVSGRSAWRDARTAG